MEVRRQLSKLILAFHHVGLPHRTQIVRLGVNDLHQLGPLGCSQVEFLGGKKFLAAGKPFTPKSKVRHATS